MMIYSVKKIPSISKIIKYIVLLLFVLMTVGPIWIMFVNATRSTEEITQGISMLPSKYLLVNWKLLSSRGTFNAVTGFYNSMIISCSFTFLAVYFGSLAAYGIHVYNFKGSKFILVMIIGVILIPQQLTYIGYYQYMSQLKLTNTFLPLIFPGLASSTTVFFMKQYMSSTLHKDLIYAGRIDGCSEIGIFHRIVVPILAPGMATMATFAFVSSWNNFMLPVIMLTNNKKYTLPLMVQLLKGDAFRVEYGSLYLGIVLSVLPIIAAYIIFSKKIIGGVSAGSVKG